MPDWANVLFSRCYQVEGATLARQHKDSDISTEWREDEGIYTTHHYCHTQCSNIIRSRTESCTRVTIARAYP